MKVLFNRHFIELFIILFNDLITLNKSDDICEYVRMLNVKNTKYKTYVPVPCLCFISYRNVSSELFYLIFY